MDKELEEKAQILLDAAHDFWVACRPHGGGAVRWLAGKDGEVVIFTRGEYKDQLMSNIHKLPGMPELIFESLEDEEED